MMATRQPVADDACKTHDEINDHAAARWLSAVYQVGDLAEAVYVGGAHWLPRERTTWRMVFEQDELAHFIPHPPPPDWPGDDYAAPMTELTEAVKLGSVLDE